MPIVVFLLKLFSTEMSFENQICNIYIFLVQDTYEIVSNLGKKRLTFLRLRKKVQKFSLGPNMYHFCTDMYL